jgi:hypothetical protein
MVTMQVLKAIQVMIEPSIDLEALEMHASFFEVPLAQLKSHHSSK